MYNSYVTGSWESKSPTWLRQFTGSVRLDVYQSEWLEQPDWNPAKKKFQ